MMQLHAKETGVFVGTITDAQLQFLIDQLEEESTDDTDYYIDHTKLDLFEGRWGPRPTCSRCCGRRWGRTKASRLSGPARNGWPPRLCCPTRGSAAKVEMATYTLR